MATVNLSSIITPANVLTASNAETLTNKTIAFGSNTLTDVASLATSQTLTNKTINIASNTLTGVQSTLVSGTSIKTINSTSLLGSGNIVTGGITLGAPLPSTSGTAITFTGIPAGTKRITVMFVGVSTDGTSEKQIQIGDSGGLETSGYLSVGNKISGGTVTSGVTGSGWVIFSEIPADVLSGSVILSLENSSAYSWVAQGILQGRVGSNATYIVAGNKTLSSELTQISVTTQNGTDTFDAGEINILFE